MGSQLNQILPNQRERSIRITNAELDRIITHSFNPSLPSEGRVVVAWNRESLMNIINSNNYTEEKINDTISKYNKWLKDSEPLNIKFYAIREKVRKNKVVTDVINDKKELTNSSIAEYKELLTSQKGTILSELKITTTLETKKPLGSFGDITLNEALIKGLSVIDTPLVQMIRDNVDVKVAGALLSSMFLYKNIVNLYVKSAYSQSLTEVLKSGPSTRGKEIAVFMLVGAPLIAGLMLTTNKIIGPKVVINLVSNNELEGSSSVSNSFSLFLLFNKIPTWLKAILKYLASYCIL